MSETKRRKAPACLDVFVFFEQERALKVMLCISELPSLLSKNTKVKYTELQFCPLSCMGVKLGFSQSGRDIG